MSILAIGDLHLSASVNKPMDIFGEAWVNHTAKIKAGWEKVVETGDLVLVLGDISWAMKLEEAVLDLKWIENLKGTKLLIRGNHDYWWSSLKKVRAALPPSLFALQNDSFLWGDTVICGTRGWVCPGEEGFDEERDEKIYRRELERLRLSLEDALRKEHKRIIAALHYPPFNRQHEESGFTLLLEEYRVDLCVFGHIHDEGRNRIFQGEKRGVSYRFAAADGINFTPIKLW